MGKLTKLQVIIIGVLVNLIVGVGLYFFPIRPAQDRLKKVTAELEATRAEAAKLESATRDLEKATLENLEARLKYRRYEESKMPVITFENRTQGMIAMWREQAEVLGPMIERWPRRYGVEMLSNVSIPAASTDPNSYQDQLMKLEVGNIQVRGDYQAILRHLRGWNNFGRLVRIGPMSLEGISPYLTASYNLTVFMWPRGSFGQTVSIAAPTGQAGQAGGAGLPGSMPDAMPAPGAGPGPAPPVMPPAPGGAAVGPGDAPPPPPGP